MGGIGIIYFSTDADTCSIPATYIYIQFLGFGNAQENGFLASELTTSVRGIFL